MASCFRISLEKWLWFLKKKKKKKKKIKYGTYIHDIVKKFKSPPLKIYFSYEIQLFYNNYKKKCNLKWPYWFFKRRDNPPFLSRKVVNCKKKKKFFKLVDFDLQIYITKITTFLLKFHLG